MTAMFLHDERMHGGQPATGSAAIPIGAANGAARAIGGLGGAHLLSNLSGSPVDSLGSLSQGKQASVNLHHFMMMNQVNGAGPGGDAGQNMSYAPIHHAMHYQQQQNPQQQQRQYAGQFIGSLPHDPYPSPMNRTGSTAGIGGVPPSMLHQDTLSMVYGQSCPEPAFPAHPGRSQSQQPQQLVYPHYGSPDMHSASPGALSNSLFQFRTAHPASTEQIIEKQKKRKESHNAVERRRRDHINEMIQQLGQMVDQEGSESARLNKGEILQRAVERIRLLEQIVHHQTEHLGRVDPSFKLPIINVSPRAVIQDEEGD